jgi:quercetin dioxygenase-like cupin family protein
MTTLQQRPVHAPGETDVLEHVGMACRVVLSGEATGGSYSIVEERARLGAMTPRHRHGREAETFMVLDGALEGWCEGVTTLVEAGTMIHLPAGLEHAFRIASETARFYTLITPAGFEEFFVASGRRWPHPFEGELPVPGPLTEAEAKALQDILTPLGVEITGPPPFGH